MDVDVGWSSLIAQNLQACQEFEEVQTPPQVPYELILKGLRQITGKDDISQKIDFPPEKIFCGICLSGI